MKMAPCGAILVVLAEREGFEPSIRVLPIYALSRGAPSTTRPSLLIRLSRRATLAVLEFTCVPRWVEARRWARKSYAGFAADHSAISPERSAIDLLRLSPTILPTGDRA